MVGHPQGDMNRHPPLKPSPRHMGNPRPLPGRRSPRPLPRPTPGPELHDDLRMPFPRHLEIAYIIHRRKQANTNPKSEINMLPKVTPAPAPPPTAATGHQPRRPTLHQDAPNTPTQPACATTTPTTPTPTRPRRLHRNPRPAGSKLPENGPRWPQPRRCLTPPPALRPRPPLAYARSCRTSRRKSSTTASCAVFPS